MLSDLLHKMSEDWKPINFCGPCRRQQIFRLAEHFCKGCQKSGAYICQQCKEHHEKFEELMSHHIKPVLVENSSQTTASVNHTSPDSDVEVFKLPLSTKNDGGGKWDSINSVHNQDFSRRLLDVIEMYERSKTLLHEAKEKRQADMRKVREERERTENEIRAIRQNLEQELEKLETDALSELDLRHQRCEISISHDIESAEQYLCSWEENMNKLCEPDDKQELEDLIKVLSTLEQETCHMLTDAATHTYFEQLKFVVNPEIQTSEFNFPSFGHFAGDSLHEFNTKLLGEHDITCDTDLEETGSDITDCCVMSDGTVVLADSSNANLKHLDKIFNVTASCHLPDPPCGVCTIDSSLVACTIPKRKTVLFVSVGKQMITQRYIYVGYGCMCVKYSPETSHLYVTYDIPMQICVFNLEGGLIQEIWRNTSYSHKDSFGRGYDKGNTTATGDSKIPSGKVNKKRKVFCFPSKKISKKDGIFTMLEDILVIASEDRIYAGDADQGLVVLSLNGSVITTIRNFRQFPEFSPRRICEGYDKEFFIFGQSEKTKEYGILYIDRHKKVQKLEGDFCVMDDIEETEAICYNRFTGQLIVSLKGEHKIKIFSVT